MFDWFCSIWDVFSSSDTMSHKRSAEHRFPTVTLPDFPNKDRILGTIYGNCIGDAVGLLSEFMCKSEAKKYYEQYKGNLLFAHKVPDMHRARWENGDWTDDSDQMILIMDSLIAENGQVDYKDYGRRLKNWARHGFAELGDYAGMGLGATTHYVLKHKSYETDPHVASQDIWEKSGCQAAPNGAAMRTSVLGVYDYGNIHNVMANTLNICKVTHHDHRCQASVIAITTAIALMLKGDYTTKNGDVDVDKIIAESYSLACTAFTGLKDKKAKEKELHRYMNMKLHELKLDDRETIGYTFKAMGSGFWALRQNDFNAAMEAIVFEAGDADSNGAVAGAMLGCKLGYSRLPPKWRDELVHKNWLDGKILKFVGLMFPDQATRPSNDGPSLANLNMSEHDRDPSHAAAPNARSSSGHSGGSPMATHSLNRQGAAADQDARNPGTGFPDLGKGHESYKSAHEDYSPGRDHVPSESSSHLEVSKAERRRQYVDHDMQGVQKPPG